MCSRVVNNLPVKCNVVIVTIVCLAGSVTNRVSNDRVGDTGIVGITVSATMIRLSEDVKNSCMIDFEYTPKESSCDV